MAKMFCCSFVILKIVDILVDNIHQVASFFFKIWGCLPPDPIACVYVSNSLQGYIRAWYVIPSLVNPESATYNLQQTTISNFAAFSKITNKA